MEDEKLVSPQQVIEEEMKKIIEIGNFESAQLFSDEGLLLAEVIGNGPVAKDNLIEIALRFQELKKMTDVMDNNIAVKDIIMEGKGRRKLVFRFFNAFEQLVILAIVVPPRKTYRKFTNQLVRLVKNVSQ
jgi:hypothetical protein